MKKFLIIILTICVCCLSGCGEKKKFIPMVSPDIDCAVEEIIENISTLEDEDCNKLYAGKIIRARGTIINKGTDGDGATVVTLGYRKGNQHSWAVRVYIHDEKDREILKKMERGQGITLQGTVAKSGLTIPRNEDRVVELLEGRFVQK